MRFKSFEIKNFKGIESLKLNLSSEPNSNVYTLVGLNESGKTTILEAISFFGLKYKSADTLVIEKSQDDIHNLIPIGKIDNFNGSIELSGTIALEAGEYEQIKEKIKKKLNINLTGEIKEFKLMQGYPFVNSRYVGKWNNNWSINLVGKKGKDRKEKSITGQDWQECYKIIEPLLPEILYFPNFLFEFPDKIYLEGKDDKQHEFYKSLIQDILDSLDNKLEIAEHLVERIKKDDVQARRHIESVLLKMSNKVNSVIFGAWNRIFNKQISKKEIQIAYGSEKQPDDTEKAYLQFFLRDGEGIYRISERSLGFRWFFVFLLLTQFRNNRTRQSRNVLFLFDEPASNLHSTAQAQLLQSFEKLSNVIYTTHSHHLVNPMWLENTYVVKNEGLNYASDEEEYNSRKTKVSIMPYRAFVNKFPTEISYFQPILDVLDYKPGALENIPDVVITEGKNDYYSLMYFLFLLGKEDELNVLPGTSASNLEVPIQTYLAWGKNFIALLDSDKEGLVQQKRYKKDFGIVVEKKIFTLADIDSDWVNFSMESLFSEKDRLAIIRANFSGQKDYEKSLFNKSIQECLVRKTRIEVSRATKDNFEKLIAFCKANLK